MTRSVSSTFSVSLQTDIPQTPIVINKIKQALKELNILNSAQKRVVLTKQVPKESVQGVE